MNETGTKKQTKKPPTVKQMVQQRTLTRRAKIVEIIVTTGKSTQSELAEELGVTRQTIAEDIAVVTSNGTEWLDGFAAVGWIIMWQGQITTTLKQITTLTKEIEKCTSDKPNTKFEFEECPFDANSDPDNYFKWLSEYRKAISSFYLKENNFAETAALSRALSIAQQTLQQLAEREVLYKKVQSLQIFFENNKPKELKPPEPTPEPNKKKILKVIKSKK